eukprot:PhM_4_TR11616/c3_g1_i8/m.9731
MEFLKLLQTAKDEGIISSNQMLKYVKQYTKDEKKTKEELQDKLSEAIRLVNPKEIINRAKKAVEENKLIIKKIDKINISVKKHTEDLPTIDINLNKCMKITKTDDLYEFFEYFNKKVTKKVSKCHKISLTLHIVTIKPQQDDHINLGHRRTYKQERIYTTLPPMNVVIPKDLSENEKYAFCMYSYHLRNFSSEQYTTIIRLGASIIYLTPIKRLQQRMKGTVWELPLLNAINNNIKIPRNGYCVLDFIWEVVRNKYGFKNYTKERLAQEFKTVVKTDLRFGITTEEIITWRNNYHNNISIYAINPLYKRFYASAATTRTEPIKLCYMVKDNHCYPILNNTIADIIAKNGNIRQCVDIMKWRDTSDCLIECKNKQELRNKIDDNELKGAVILLPEHINAKDMINDIMLSTSTFPEYLHYDNRNQLDGFISPDMNKMIVSNNDYKLRQKVSQIMYSIFPIDQFKWRNQSLTSLVVTLFETMIGEIPKSDYNEQTVNMIDAFPTCAMKDCFCKTLEEYKDEYNNDEEIIYESFDIGKAYPSILINNDYNFPLYTIHDKVEEFFDHYEIVDGEYFIENNIMLPFKTYNKEPIQIPQGIFSKKAILFFLEKELISKKDIKYFIKAKQTLKADTFKYFIEYIFKTFDENEAKKLANMFIGFLGTKFNKSLFGYMTSSIEDCLSSWCESESETLNCSVMKQMNDIYMVKYSKIQRLYSEHQGINRHIVCDCNILLIKMMYELYDDNSIILAFNTDCINIINPRKNNFSDKVKSNGKFDLNNIGKIFNDRSNTILEIDRYYPKKRYDYTRSEKRCWKIRLRNGWMRKNYIINRRCTKGRKSINIIIYK